MKAGIGILLVFTGLTLGYLVLTGKLPMSSGNAGARGSTAEQPDTSYSPANRNKYCPSHRRGFGCISARYLCTGTNQSWEVRTVNKDQWTVTGLVLLLLGLEVVRSKTVKAFLVGTWHNFNTSLNAASKPPGK